MAFVLLLALWRNDRSDNPDDDCDESPDDTVDAHESWDDITSSTLFCL